MSLHVEVQLSVNLLFKDLSVFTEILTSSLSLRFIHFLLISLLLIFRRVFLFGSKFTEVTSHRSLLITRKTCLSFVNMYIFFRDTLCPKPLFYLY